MRTLIDGYDLSSSMNTLKGAVLVPAQAMADAKAETKTKEQASKEARVEDQGQKTYHPEPAGSAGTHGSEESRRGTGEPPTSPPNPPDPPDDGYRWPKGPRELWGDFVRGLVQGLPTQVISIILAAFVARIVSEPAARGAEVVWALLA
jgi:hypothetical protein